MQLIYLVSQNTKLMRISLRRSHSKLRLKWPVTCDYKQLSDRDACSKKETKTPNSVVKSNAPFKKTKLKSTNGPSQKLRCA